MTRYKQANFADQDTSSIGSIHLESSHNPAMHIRYHTARGTSLWRARNKLEKILILTQCCFLVVIIIFIIALISMANNKNSTQILYVEPHTSDSHCLDAPCTLPSCIHAASEILHSVDTSVQPCDD